MTWTARLESYLARVPYVALASYAAAVAVFLIVTAVQVGAVVERRNALAAAADILARLEGRAPSRTRNAETNDASMASGSPFIEGGTVTVAGAGLLQRLAGAVARAHASVLSSQVDLQGPLSKQGFIAATVSCELEQPALQELLYDIEAGMPFLLVDQLVVQAAPSAQSGDDSHGKLRVVISVSGQWQGGR